MGMKCPCFSGLDYEACCQPYHLKKTVPERAVQLMRSRYSAYALKEADYLMDTTHPENPHYMEDRVRWRISILQFCQSTQFTGLEILDEIDGKNISFVTFFARLMQNHRDTSFKEKSRFIKVDSRWLYHSSV